MPTAAQMKEFVGLEGLIIDILWYLFTARRSPQLT